MVRGRQGSGVEPLKNTIRVRFTWMGVRETVTLALKPTPANIRAAEAMMARVRSAIEGGTFRHEDYFPQLAPAAAPKVVHLFGDYSALWLKGLRVEHKTQQFYATGARFWDRHIGSDPIGEIKHSKLLTIIKDASEKVGPKSINCYLLAARGVFSLAMADEVISKDPTVGLTNERVKLKKPDPLSLEERDKVLAHMAEKYDPQVANYFEFCFLTGMRPEEVIAAVWSKVDWAAGTILVDAARVNGRDKDTKTHTDRTVDLTDHAMAVLKRQKAFTFLKGLDACIFENPITGRPWADSGYQRKNFWDPTFKALGIRKRVAYQTRHTYATHALMKGVSPIYLAKQLGHTSPMVTLRHYAFWIEGAVDHDERAKMATSHGQFRGQFRGQLGKARATEGSTHDTP